MIYQSHLSAIKAGLTMIRRPHTLTNRTNEVSRVQILALSLFPSVLPLVFGAATHLGLLSCIYRWHQSLTIK